MRRTWTASIVGLAMIGRQHQPPAVGTTLQGDADSRAHRIPTPVGLGDIFRDISYGAPCFAVIIAEGDQDPSVLPVHGQPDPTSHGVDNGTWISDGDLRVTPFFVDHLHFEPGFSIIHAAAQDEIVVAVVTETGLAPFTKG